MKSYHIFLFPFKWDYKRKNKGIFPELGHSFSERVNRKEIKDLLKENWEEDYFFIEPSLDDYNAYKYFYEYARRAIYYTKDKVAIEKPVHQYKYKKKGHFHLSVVVDKDNNKIKDYFLIIDHIILKVYQTGVGILSFHLANERYGNFRYLTD